MQLVVFPVIYGDFLFPGVTKTLMAINITTGTATTIAAQAGAIILQVNAALTGNIVVTVGGTTIATITNPTVGNLFKYGGLAKQGTVVVTPSTTCDITVTVLSRVQ